MSDWFAQVGQLLNGSMQGDFYTRVLNGITRLVEEGGALVVPEDQVFTSITQRDNFFNQNPDLLTDGALAIVNNELQRFSQEQWISLTSVIRGEKGAPGNNGISPHINIATGNWFVGTVDTGIKARGPQGIQGEPGLPSPDSGDMLASVYDTQGRKTDIFEYVDGLVGGVDGVLASILRGDGE